LKNGKIALFNLGREPIILYESEWRRLSNLIRKDILDKFVEHNRDRIKFLPSSQQTNNSNTTPVQGESRGEPCGNQCPCEQPCPCGESCPCEQQSSGEDAQC
jgi:hypothetical protein